MPGQQGCLHRRHASHPCQRMLCLTQHGIVECGKSIASLARPRAHWQRLPLLSNFTACCVVTVPMYEMEQTHLSQSQIAAEDPRQ